MLVLIKTQTERSVLYISFLGATAAVPISSIRPAIREWKIRRMVHFTFYGDEHGNRSTYRIHVRKKHVGFVMLVEQPESFIPRVYNFQLRAGLPEGLSEDMLLHHSCRHFRAMPPNER